MSVVSGAGAVEGGGRSANVGVDEVGGQGAAAEVKSSCGDISVMGDWIERDGSTACVRGSGKGASLERRAVSSEALDGLSFPSLIDSDFSDSRTILLLLEINTPFRLTLVARPRPLVAAVPNPRPL